MGTNGKSGGKGVCGTDVLYRRRINKNYDKQANTHKKKGSGLSKQERQVSKQHSSMVSAPISASRFCPDFWNYNIK